MCSEEGKDGSKGANVVGERFGFLGGEVDIATKVSYEYIVVSATRFHGQEESTITVCLSDPQSRGTPFK